MKSLFDKFMEECVEKRHLTNVQFSLTDKCNLKCLHCYVSPQPKPVLSFGEIKDIIRQLKEMGCLFLSFTGGEVFAREDIFDIIEFATARKFCISILSNGTFINKNVARFLKRNFISNVYISLYGSKPEIHDKFTGQEGSFKRTMQAILSLKQEKQRFAVSYLITKYNSEDFPRTKKLEEKLVIKINYFCVIVPKEDGQKLSQDFLVSRRQLIKFFSLEQNKTDKLQVLDVSQLNLSRPVCGAWLNKCYISAYGEVRGCVGYPISYTLGNLRKDSLKQIWNRDININRVSLRDIAIKDFLICNNCNLLSYCRLCPAHSLLEEQRFGPVKQKCMMAKAKKEFMETIKSGRENGE